MYLDYIVVTSENKFSLQNEREYFLEKRPTKKLHQMYHSICEECLINWRMTSKNPTVILTTKIHNEYETCGFVSWGTFGTYALETLSFLTFYS
jgi:hypothetical protein